MTSEESLRGLIPEPMLKRGVIVKEELLRPIKFLFEQRRVPEKGWSDHVTDSLLQLLSSMDTDKDPQAARIGEREGRVASALVARLGYGFNHGIGRSGDLTAPQPKAPGSSIAYQLANLLATDALKRLGLPNITQAFVAPVSTGLATALCLSALRRGERGKIVVYPRADHGSPVKGIRLAGLSERVVEGQVVGDAVRVPISEVEKVIDDETIGILSTTSFFPPREADDVKEIAKIAEKRGLIHIVNHAYGFQSREWTKMVRAAIDAGRVDAVIQSTDKNFLTPVGGTIIACAEEGDAEKISKAYPGRASAAPVIQFLAAILALGIDGYEALRDEQGRVRSYLEERLLETATKIGQRVLKVNNPIAGALTLAGLDPRKLGGALFNLRVTGPRALAPMDFGTCCKEYPTSYVTINAAIGSLRRDVDLALARLEEAVAQVR